MEVRTHAYCPACKEESAINREGTCLWCGGPTEERKAGGKPKGVFGKLSDDHLRALHRFHIEAGLSIRALGRRIWRQAGFASEKSAAMAISSGFERLGLAARSRSDAIAAANRQRRAPDSPGTDDRAAYKRWLRERAGGRRQCKGLRRWPPAKGRRCSRWAMADSDFCFQHDPRRQREVVASARRMREHLPPTHSSSRAGGRVMAELLLGQLVAGGGGEHCEHPGVLADPGLVGFAGDQRPHVGGEAEDFGRGLGLGHVADDSACNSENVLVSALANKQGSRRANAQPSYSRRSFR